MGTDEDVEHVPAAEWRELRIALMERMRSLLERQCKSPDLLEQAQLQKRIEEVKEQVRALAVEESVAQFLENAERYITATSAIDAELQRDPDEEIA